MNRKFIFVYIVAFCFIQVLINNFLDISQLLYISLLPLSVFCLPGKQQKIIYLISAFLIGLVIDFTSSGVVGITSCALLVCVMLRPAAIHLIYTKGLSVTDENFIEEERFSKEMFLSLGILCGVYFLIYCWIDSAGTVALDVLLLKWFYSTACSTALCALTKSVILR